MREPPVPVVGEVTVFPGRTEALVRWSTIVPADAQVEFGRTTNYGSLSPRAPEIGTNHIVFLSGMTPNTTYYFRAISRADGDIYHSARGTFATAGEIIVDNPAASFTGVWTLGTSATDKYGSNYHYASAVSGAPTATASFIPSITVPGNYDVYLWHSQGGNRSTNAPVQVIFDGGTFSTHVNQTSGGGSWRLITSARRFARGTAGLVRLSNNSGESSKVIIADAVRWVYSANQESPVAPLPEWWAAFYSQGDADADTDQDGYSAYAEYLLGTDPTRAASRLELKMEWDAAGARAFFRPYVADRRYRLGFGAGFGDNQAWEILPDIPAAAGDRGVFELGPDSPRGFFRLQASPGP
jgi:hypothetical protein